MNEERPAKISVYLTPEQRAKFKAVCAFRNQSMNEVLVEFINELIDKSSSKSDRI